MKVYDFLRYGKENAIPTKTLAQAMGFRSVRDLQKQVELERREGKVILCDPAGAGYYLSDDPKELRVFTRALCSRARNTLHAARSAIEVLKEAEKQKAAPGAGTSESGNANNDGDSISQKASMRNEED